MKGSRRRCTRRRRRIEAFFARNFSWRRLVWGASTAFSRETRVRRTLAPRKRSSAPATPPAEEAVERGPLRGASDQRPQEGCCLLVCRRVTRAIVLTPALVNVGAGGTPSETHHPLGDAPPRPRRRRDPGTTKTLGIDVGEGVGRRAVSQARADSLYHFTSLAMPSEKGVWGS